MTDSIDLDELDTGEEGEEEGQEGNYGDFVWREESDPAAEFAPSDVMTPTADGAEGTATPSDSDRSDTGHSEREGGAVDSETGSGESGEAVVDDRGPLPGVPRSNDGPVGVPADRGGAGTGPGNEATGRGGRGDVSSSRADERTDPDAHGTADPDDMTTALTYKAAHHFANPAAVFADARQWSDWIGIVGEVSTPAIRKFQRDERIELDFFGGSESGPAARLAEVDEESMFYAERMVLIGVADTDEWIAEDAGWEFVPLEKAAEKADWKLDPDRPE